MGDMIDRDAALALEDGAGFVDANAIRALPAVKVGVKPLVWKDGDVPANAVCHAITAFGAYFIETDSNVWYMLYSPHMMALGVHPTLDAAKAAAQADYEARGRAMWEPVTQPALDATAYRDGFAAAIEQVASIQSDGPVTKPIILGILRMTLAGMPAPDADDRCGACGSDVTDMDGHIVHEEGCEGEQDGDPQPAPDARLRAAVAQLDAGAIRDAALREAADLCNKPPSEGGMAKSMAFFIRAEGHAFYRRACEEYRDAILALLTEKPHDRKRKLPQMRGNEPFTAEEVAARMDELCGCSGRYACDCVSVLNQAMGDLWTKANTEKPHDRA